MFELFGTRRRIQSQFDYCRQTGRSYFQSMKVVRFYFFAFVIRKKEKSSSNRRVIRFDSVASIHRWTTTFSSPSFRSIHLTNRTQALSRHIECIHAPILYSIKLQRIRRLALCGVIDWYDLIVNAAERLSWFFSSSSLRLSIATRFHLWHFIRCHSSMSSSATALAAVFLRIYFPRIFICPLMPLHTARTDSASAALLLLYCLLNWPHFFLSQSLPENQAESKYAGKLNGNVVDKNEHENYDERVCLTSA